MRETNFSAMSVGLLNKSTSEFNGKMRNNTTKSYQGNRIDAQYTKNDKQIGLAR